MTASERIRSVLAGKRPDRPPVSFWHHFGPGSVRGQPAVEAHLNHLRRYGLDFLKVMNDNGYPAEGPVRRASDLRRLGVRCGLEDEFAAQLELITALANQLEGQVPLVTTVFNAWAVLRRIVTPSRSDRPYPPQLGGDPVEADVRMAEFVAEDRYAVAMALEVIAQSLANFTRRCLRCGADGVFLSVRDDWGNAEIGGASTYRELVCEGDQQILAAAEDGWLNILHVCGIPRDFEAFAEYPVQVINWADRAAGPAIGEVSGRIRPVICGGVDNLHTLPNGTPAQVEQEVYDALRQAGDHPMIVSAGCTFDPDVVPPENLDAMVRAARATCPPAE